MRFRPEHDPRSQRVVDAEHDPEPGSAVQWEDNTISNAFAWASYRITPTWCQTEDHWTSRMSQHLFTDCPCCLLFRGLTIGAIFGITFGVILGMVTITIFYGG